MEAIPHPDPSGLTRRARRRLAAGALVTVVAATSAGIAVPSGTAHAIALPPRPVIASRDASGAMASTFAGFADLSGNSRFLVFATTAKMVSQDGNDQQDIYLKDRWSGSIELISVSTAGVVQNGMSGFPTISDDGNRVAFQTTASNLGGTETLGHADVFVRDRKAGTTKRVSVSTSGGELTAPSGRPSISGNGRYVVFDTTAPNAVPSDVNGASDVIVRDTQANTNDRVSVNSNEIAASASSWSPSISDDGRYVAFTSGEELDGGQPGDSTTDVYVRDRTAGTTVNAHVSSAEATASGGNAGWPVISGNGRYVAFGSEATNLIGSDSNGASDVFRRDLLNGVTIRVSVHDNGTVLSKPSYVRDVSDDGGQILFDTDATATSATDVGPDRDVFVRNVAGSTTRRVSTSPVVADPTGNGSGDALSDDGTIAAFSKAGQSLVASPTSHVEQVYVSEAMQLGPFASLAAFIDQQYLDFLGRAATAGEQQSWQAKLLDGRATPSSMIAALAGSESFAKHRAPVVRLYWAFFLRKPDPSGLSYWIKKYETGTKLGTIAQGFAKSSEFKNRYGTLGNEDFVKLIYPNIFERQPDPSGLAYWTGKLDRKEITRGGVMIGFSESSEGVRRLAPQVNITLISQGMLRVSPPPAFWDAAFPVYKGGEKELAWLAQTTLVSGTYAARF
jgi:Tol biopolymer transport system component